MRHRRVVERRLTRLARVLTCAREDERLQVKVTVRLSPYAARALWKLRTQGLPEGARPRTSTEVIVHALLAAAAERSHK